MEFKKVRLNVPLMEAVQIDGDNLDEIAEWVGGEVVGDTLRATIVRRVIRYPEDEGYEETAYMGDWFLRNTENGQIDLISGEGYPKNYREDVTVRCQFCFEDKTFDEMTKRSDGQFSTMCQSCEDKQTEKINARRKQLSDELLNPIEKSLTEEN